MGLSWNGEDDPVGSGAGSIVCDAAITIVVASANDWVPPTCLGFDVDQAEPNTSLVGL